MTIVTPETTAQREAEARTRTIAGLRELADWLEANPAATVGEHGYVRLQYSADCYTGSPAAARAEVDRVAEVLGTKAELDGTHYRAEKDFVGAVSYVAVSVDDDAAVAA